MQLQLSKKDRKKIRYFLRKDVGILLEVKAHLIDERNGAMIVTCADGDQMVDVFSHHIKVCREHRHDARIHLFSLNGGAKLIAKCSPLRLGNEDKIIIGHLRAAREMKEIETVVLYAHAPCGAAYGKGLNITDVLKLLFKAKSRVKRKLPGIKVACFFHVDYGKRKNGTCKKRTYFVSRDAWLRWKKSKKRKQRRRSKRTKKKR